MKKSILGMTADVASVINENSARCQGCGKETEQCVKLYKSTGSNRTMCVELK